MAVTLAQVLTTVDDALRRGYYEDKLGRVAEYDVTFCALDRVVRWRTRLKSGRQCLSLTRSQAISGCLLQASGSGK